jgi:hypothetical protein
MPIAPSPIVVVVASVTPASVPPETLDPLVELAPECEPPLVPFVPLVPLAPVVPDLELFPPDVEPGPWLEEPFPAVDEPDWLPLSLLPPRAAVPQPVIASAAKAPSCKSWRREPSMSASTGALGRSSLSLSDKTASDSRG